MDPRALEFGAYGRFAAFMLSCAGMIAGVSRTHVFPMRLSALDMATEMGREQQFKDWTCRNDTNAVCLREYTEASKFSGTRNHTEVVIAPWNGTSAYEAMPTMNGSTMYTTPPATFDHTVRTSSPDIAFTFALLLIFAMIFFAAAPLIIPDLIPSSWNAEVTELKQKEAKLARDLESAKLSNSEVLTANGQLKDRVEGLKAEAEFKNAEVTELKEKEAKLERDLESAKLSNSDMLTAYGQLADKVEGLEAEAEVKKADNAALKAREEALEIQHDQDMEAKDLLSKQNEELQKDYDKLYDQSCEQYKDLEEADKLNKTFKASSERTESDNAALLGELEETKDELEEAQKTIRTLKASSERIESDNAALLEELEETKDELEEARQESNAVREDLTVAQTTISKLEVTVDKQLAETSHHLHEIEKLKKEIAQPMLTSDSQPSRPRTGSLPSSASAFISETIASPDVQDPVPTSTTTAPTFEKIASPDVQNPVPTSTTPAPTSETTASPDIRDPVPSSTTPVPTFETIASPDVRDLVPTSTTPPSHHTYFPPPTALVLTPIKLKLTKDRTTWAMLRAQLQQCDYNQRRLSLKKRLTGLHPRVRQAMQFNGEMDSPIGRHRRTFLHQYEEVRGDDIGDTASTEVGG
ncbi:hypothetical protein P7C71_g5595, partial [Lecanoromycetidae sp. Uapishka_2]